MRPFSVVIVLPKSSKVPMEKGRMSYAAFFRCNFPHFLKVLMVAKGPISMHHLISYAKSIVLV
jgi:hypothetical protein